PKGKPPSQAQVRFRQWLIFHRQVEFIDGEAMEQKRTRSESALAERQTWEAGAHLGRAFQCERVQRLLANPGIGYEDSQQDSRAHQFQEPIVDASDGTKFTNDTGLLPVEDAHRVEFVKQMPVSGLEDQSRASIPSHGAPRSRTWA